jgi:hypothetical protein
MLVSASEALAIESLLLQPWHIVEHQLGGHARIYAQSTLCLPHDASGSVSSSAD